MIRTIKAFIFLAKMSAYAFIAGVFVFLITGLVDYSKSPTNTQIIFTDKDTTISKQHLIELQGCSDELENKKYILYTMKEAIQSKDKTIKSLKAHNSTLKYQIKQHNAKVKNPKSKYWIDTNTN